MTTSRRKLVKLLALFGAGAAAEVVAFWGIRFVILHEHKGTPK